MADATPPQSGSPADSVKTAGPSMPMDPIPRGPAVFSTNFGKKPHRPKIDPPPPVVVRSDRIRGVVHFSHSWYFKYPREYQNYFPNCGHTIYDLWDERDIQLEGESFVTEALKFITQDNAFYANQIAQKWSVEKRDVVERVCSPEVQAAYDPDRPLAILDEIYRDGEMEKFGHTFLWNVALMMRTAMVNASYQVDDANQAPAQASAETHTQTEAVGQEVVGQEVVGQQAVGQEAEQVSSDAQAVDKQEGGAGLDDNKASHAGTSKSKSNRKKRRTRRGRLTASSEASSTAETSKTRETSEEADVPPLAEPSEPFPVVDTSASQHAPEPAVSQPVSQSLAMESAPQPTPVQPARQPSGPKHFTHAAQPQGPPIVGPHGPVAPLVPTNTYTQAQNFAPVPGPRMPYQNVPEEYAMPMHPVQMPAQAPYSNQPPPRYNRGKYNRATSYNQSMSMQAQPMHGNRGWAENLPHMPSGSHSRPPSGSMPATESPQYQPLVPMQPLRLSHGTQMAPYQVNPLNLSPSMPTAQPAYGPVGYAHVMMPPAVPYGMPVMGPGQQPYHPSMGPRSGMPVDDTANVAQQPYGYRPRAGSANHRNNQGNKQELYNPYGSEKPDFGVVPSQPSGRKGGRGSFSNQPGRGRRYSMASQNRFPHYHGDHGDYNNPHYSGPRQPEPPRYMGPQRMQQPMSDNDDLSRSDDPEYGCGPEFIGPKNNTVIQLWVGGGHEAVTMQDLHQLFTIAGNIEMRNANVREDRRGANIGLATFYSTADARRALAMNGTYINGKHLNVKVSRKHFGERDPQHYSPVQHRPGLSASSENQSMSHGPQGSDAMAAPGGPSYSPQDARSDLQQRPRQHSVGTTGSPESRKPKKQFKSPSKKPSAEQEGSHVKQTPGIGVGQPQDVTGRTALTDKPNVTDTHDSIHTQAIPATTAKSHVVTGTSTGDVVQPVTVVDSSRDTTLDDKNTASGNLPSDSASQQVNVEPELQNVLVGEASPSHEPHNAPTFEHNIPNPSAEVQTTESVAPVEATSPSGLDSSVIMESTAVQVEPEVTQKSPAKMPLEGDILTASPSNANVPKSAAWDEEASEGQEKVESGVYSSKEKQLKSAKTEDDQAPIITESAPQVVPATAPALIDNVSPAQAEFPQSTTTDQAMPVSEPKEKDIASHAASAGATKKQPGAKQTESLFAYAKSKGQRKKEKQAQKKEKKKAKAGKSGAPTKLSDTVDSNEDPSLSSVTAGVSSIEADYATAVGLGSPAGKNVVGRSNITAEDEKFANSSGAGGGGADGGNNSDSKPKVKNHPVFSPNLISLTQVQTPKLEVPKHREAVAALSPEDVPRTPSDVADSDEKVEAAKALIRLSSEAKKFQGFVKYGKSASAKIAIPDPKLLARKWSHSSKESASSSTKPTPSTAISPISTLGPFGEEKGASSQVKTEKDALDIMVSSSEGGKGKARVDTAPIASSATVQPSSSPLASPSPTAADFYTPLQTPTALLSQTSPAPPPDQAEPTEPAKSTETPKKKKKKRHSKKTTKSTDQSAEKVPAAEGEPFGDQMKLLDDIQNKSSFSYYAAQEVKTPQASPEKERKAREAFEAAAIENKASAKAKSQVSENPQSVLDDILNYMNKKGAVGTDKTWDENNHQPAAPIDPEELRDIFNGERSTKASRMAKQFTQRSKEEKVPSAGKFPLVKE